MLLTPLEAELAANILPPEELGTSFEDISGLEDIHEELEEMIIDPFSDEVTGSSDLHSAPKGVLLYGPPGCGKTMTVPFSSN